MAATEDTSAKAERKSKAESALKARVRVGHEQQQAAIKAVLSMGIKDTLVAPEATNFSLSDSDTLRLQQGQEHISLHPHALSQICDTVNIPRSYVSRLGAGKHWERNLLCWNLNELMHKTDFAGGKRESVKFLHRTVNGQLRGFLSRRYNRNLSTAPLLRTFLETCQTKGAGAIEADTSDLRTTLKCVLPMVFEPVEGEYVAFGVTFTNSDFGAGRLKLSGTVMRISSGTISVLEDKYSKVHVGKPILESEIEMTEDTDNKVLVAAQGVIRDTVNAVLSDESLEIAMRAIQAASEAEIPWHKLKDLLNNVLGKKDLELMKSMIESPTYDLIQLPPAHTHGEDKILTEWGAANLIGWFATKEEDSDRKSALQDVAGKLLKVSS